MRNKNNHYLYLNLILITILPLLSVQSAFGLSYTFSGDLMIKTYGSSGGVIANAINPGILGRFSGTLEYEGRIPNSSSTPDPYMTWTDINRTQMVQFGEIWRDMVGILSITFNNGTTMMSTSISATTMLNNVSSPYLEPNDRGLWVRAEVNLPSNFFRYPTPELNFGDPLYFKIGFLFDIPYTAFPNYPPSTLPLDEFISMDTYLWDLYGITNDWFLGSTFYDPNYIRIPEDTVILGVRNLSISLTPVPEPSLMVLLGISVLSLAGLRKWWKE